MRFGLELMSRVQNRTVTGVVASSLRSAMMAEKLPDGSPLASLLDDVWAVDEPLRLVLLATRAPHLLAYDERRVWETIRASPDFWKGRHADRVEGIDVPDFWKGRYTDHAEDVDLDALRRMWGALLAHVSENQAGPAIVPFDSGKPADPINRS